MAVRSELRAERVAWAEVKSDSRRERADRAEATLASRSANFTSVMSWRVS